MEGPNSNINPACFVTNGVDVVPLGNLAHMLDWAHCPNDARPLVVATCVQLIRQKL